MQSTFPVVLDACVLYPLYLRDTLLRAAERDLFRVHWPNEILDEAMRNLVKDLHATQAQVDRTKSCMNEAFPEALVDPPQPLIEAMTNDPKDRHVVATAIVADAKVIVTSNLKDFQTEALAPYGIEAISPDQFLIHQFDLSPAAMIELLEEQANDCSRPPLSLYELLQKLSRVVPGFMSAVRVYLSNQP